MELLEIKNSHGEVLHSAQVPASWADVNIKMYRRIFPILFSAFSPGYLIRLYLVKRLLFSTHNPITWLRHWFWIRQMSGEIIYDISESFNWIWAKPAPKAWFKSFLFRFRRYHLPSDLLENATFIEYMYADNCLEQVAANQGDLRECEALDQLVATLCRPSKWFHWLRKYQSDYDGDIRQRFNDSLMKRRAKKFRKLPIRWKLYVLSYFVACKTAIVEDPAYRYVFPQNRRKVADQEGGDLSQLLMSLAHLKVYGNFDETAYQNLHTILTNLNTDNRIAAEQRRSKK